MYTLVFELPRAL